ncbi:MAG TPA: hypothetical protein ENN13_01065 [Candidatus Altiarchaeales archaeon]|nr:hypothetical protein [Candidatus Altiarchaeales archaeon]
MREKRLDKTVSGGGLPNLGVRPAVTPKFLEEFRARISGLGCKDDVRVFSLIKALVSESGSVTRSEAGDLDDISLEKYVVKCGENPESVVRAQNHALTGISREIEKYPDSYEWEGRRGRYRIARHTLNQIVNEVFNLTLPLSEKEAELKRKREGLK